MEYDDKVLIVGDSITRHYFPFAKDSLAKHEVEAVEPDKWVSCQWKQLRFLQKALQAKRCYGGRKLKAKTVHFNFGLHSIKLPNKGHDPMHQRAEEKEFEIYENELNEQIEILKGFNVSILFSNTTPSPKNHKVRSNLDVIRLNEIAQKVMKEQNVPYNDVYSFVKSQEDYPLLYLHPKAENNCHFNDVGRKLLGTQISKFILDNMKFANLGGGENNSIQED